MATIPPEEPVPSEFIKGLFGQRRLCCVCGAQLGEHEEFVCAGPVCAGKDRNQEIAKEA